MADITQTAANVARISGDVDNSRLAGEAITAGDTVYIAAADNRYYRGDNNDTAAKADVKGVALNSALAAGSPVSVQFNGIVNPGGTVTVGEVYVQSSNVGKWAPVADISTNYVTVLGVGITSSRVQLILVASGIQHA